MAVLFGAGVAQASFAANPSQGQLRICRDARTVMRADAGPVVLPAGAQFVAAGGTPRLLYRIAVDGQVTLPVPPGCAIAAAHVVANPLNQQVDYGRHLLATFSLAGFVPAVTIAGGFR